MTRAVFANWVAAFEGNGISYDFVSDMDEIWISMDRVFYERIVNNLLKNAMEHSGASKIWIKIEQTGITAAVKICDNGVGIPEKAIPFVFDRLYKADDARSSKGTGFDAGREDFCRAPKERKLFCHGISHIRELKMNCSAVRQGSFFLLYRKLRHSVVSRRANSFLQGFRKVMGEKV